MVYAIVGDRTILGSQILPLIKEYLRQIEGRKYLLKKIAVTELFFEKPTVTEFNKEGFEGFLKKTES